MFIVSSVCSSYAPHRGSLWSFLVLCLLVFCPHHGFRCVSSCIIDVLYCVLFFRLVFLPPLWVYLVLLLLFCLFPDTPIMEFFVLFQVAFRLVVLCPHHGFLCCCCFCFFAWLSCASIMDFFCVFLLVVVFVFVCPHHGCRCLSSCFFRLGLLCPPS